MTRKIALLLVFAMVLAVFAGCTGSTNTNSGTDTPSSQPGTTGTTPSTPSTGGSTSGSTTPAEPSGGTEPVEEDSPYKFAKGKFTTDDKGISTQAYTYEMPLTTTNEVFSMWTTIYTPQYIPEEGYGSLPLPAYDRELTGVNIEYEIIETSNLQSNLSVLRAADDFRDIMCSGARYYGGVDTDILTEGYFVNLYDYRDYIPNYFYLVKYYDPTDIDTYDKVFLSEDQVASMWVLYHDPAINSVHIMRKDWLDKLNIDVNKIITFDDIVDACRAVKANIPTCKYPFMLVQSIEQSPVFDFSPAFGTLAYVSATTLCPRFLVDGKVTFANMNDTDRELAKALNGLIKEDLVPPDWMGVQFGSEYSSQARSGEIFYYSGTPADIVNMSKNNDDPNCEWTVVRNPLQYEDQVLHVASDRTRLLTSCTFNISSKCENIELIATWCDWFFSEEGGDLWSYGLEGVSWEYNDKGDRVYTELIYNNPQGIATTWAISLYAGYVGCVALNFFNKRNFMDPNTGADAWNLAQFIINFNEEHYDKSGHFPTGAKLTEEETAAVNAATGDVMTFMAENYLAFITGDKNFSEWDAYVAELKSMGMDIIIDAYQAAYDRYKAA